MRKQISKTRKEKLYGRKRFNPNGCEIWGQAMSGRRPISCSRLRGVKGPNLQLEGLGTLLGQRDSMSKGSGDRPASRETDGMGTGRGKGALVPT